MEGDARGAPGLLDEQRDGFHQGVLHALPEAVVVTAPDGRITFVNAAAERLFGYETAEMLGQPITLLTPPQPGRRADLVSWLARWAAAPDPEQSRFLDLAAKRKDGAALVVQVRVRSGAVGGVLRYLVTVRDDTERRRSEVALRDSNLRAARTLLLAEDAIISIDEAQTITFFNQAAERMFGYRNEEVVGQSLSLLLPPAARENHPVLVEAFSRSRQPSRMMSQRTPVEGLRRSGETFPIEATITQVKTGGTLTFTAHLRDVSDRNRTRDLLQERERRIRAVFDNAGAAIALLSPDGAVLEINQAARALAAQDRSPIGLPLWEVSWLPAAPGVQQGLESLRQAVRSSAAGVPTRLLVMVTRGGAPEELDVRLTPIPGEDGALAYVLAEGRFVEAEKG